MPRERLDRQGAEMQVDVVATSVPVPAAGVFSDTVEQLDVFAHCVLDRRAALADRVGDLDREGEPLPAAVEQLYGLLGLAPIVECHRLPAGLCGVAPRDAVGDVAIPRRRFSMLAMSPSCISWGQICPHVGTKLVFAQFRRVPRVDSNPHWIGFEPNASAGWATGACSWHVCSIMKPHARVPACTGRRLSARRCAR